MNEAPARPRGGNGKAIVLGILATIIGAGLWAVVTVVTEREFSLVAIGIGALVGLTMFSAKPTSTGIAAVAALLTVIGCALGEFLAIPAYVAHKEGIGFGKLINLELKEPRLYFDSLDGKTYLFWAIGAVAAFSMVFRRIQAARVATASSNVAAAYAPQQPYGTSPEPGAAAVPGQPYAPQQPYGQEQAPYGQGPQSYGPPQQPHGPQQQPYGQGQQPGYGQAPPR